MVVRAHFPPFTDVDRPELEDKDEHLPGAKAGVVYLEGWYTAKQLKALAIAIEGSRQPIEEYNDGTV